LLAYKLEKKVFQLQKIHIEFSIILIDEPTPVFGNLSYEITEKKDVFDTELYIKILSVNTNKKWITALLRKILNLKNEFKIPEMAKYIF